MKTLFLSLAILFCGSAHAELSTSKLAGSWKSNCTQSQINGKQGFTTETYVFKSSGDYEFTRQWYKDANCKEVSTEKDSESGSIKIGKENTNNGFNPENTYEVEYKNKKGTDLGLIWVDKNLSKMRVARGTGNSQNTMLGFFQYSKVK